MRRIFVGALAAVAAIGVPVVALQAGTPTPAASPPAAAAETTTTAKATQPDAARPRFSGSWKLAVERSQFGKIPGGQPSARTDVIEHEGTRIRQTLYLVNGSRHDTTVYLYSTDGTPTVNKVDGRDIRSVVAWEGGTLHLVSTTKLLILDMSLNERWKLAADGRTLTMARRVKYGIGEGDQILVFERQ